MTYKTTNPTEIAEYGGIPRSKIYDTLGSLVEKGFIQLQDKTYLFNPLTISRIRESVARTSSMFDNSLARIAELYPRIAINITQEVERALKAINFEILNTGPLKIPEDLLAALSRNPSRQYLQAITTVDALSPTSGHKVAIAILAPSASTQRVVSGEVIEYLDYILRRSAGFDWDTVFLLTEPKVESQFRHYREYALGRRLKQISLSSDYTSKLKEELVHFDRQWQQKKESLTRLEADVEIPYREISRLTTRLSELRGTLLNSESKATMEGWLFQALNEVLDRIDADLHAASEKYMDLRYRQKQMLSNLRERRVLPGDADLNGFQNSIATLSSDVQQQGKEVGTLSDEFLYLRRTDPRYLERGYRFNPFVFTIPVEEHLDLVNQENVVTHISSFLKGMTSGESAANVLFLVDEPGMGKTHLMKYFLNRIAEGEVGQVAGLYVRCLPGSDILALFSQLGMAVNSLRDENMKLLLKSSLSQSSPPTTVNELVDSLRKMSQLAYERGERTFILFIDEFENIISTFREPTTAFIQLRSLLETPHVGYVVAMRKDFFDPNKVAFTNVFSALRPYTMLNLEKFNADSSAKLIRKRLDMFRLPQTIAERITFSKEAIANLTLESNGRPREIIRFARDAFRTSVDMKKNEIGMEVVTQLLKAA
jgi:sugar-specific transcriptional regulator TrmB/Cdc6-like AAA superfamily ATPase